MAPEASNALRLFDPRLSSGLRDEGLLELRCLATRPPRHHRGQTLTARAAGRVFSGGDAATDTDAVCGRVNAWSTSTGAMLCATRLDSPAMCLAVVETVRPVAQLRAGGPARRTGAADGFGCELIVWAGQADGRIAVLAGGDLTVRLTLGGHRGAIACICSPGAPPSQAAVGAAVVLSGGEDGAMRLWDARTAECLRSIPGGGAALRAMLPVWTPDGSGGRQERCRVWSADAEQTLCVWEPHRPAAPAAKPVPTASARERAAGFRGGSRGCGGGTGGGGGGARGMPAEREPPPPQTVTLNADVSDLAVSTDGTLVCASAGRDGVLVLDGNARLRSRLACAAAAAEAITAIHIVGRGRQLWTGAANPSAGTTTAHADSPRRR
jgi:hypothetical protein